jgi:AAA ATPase domain
MQKATKTKARAPGQAKPLAIEEIRVAGFKSISDEQRIEIRPLTVLAGANSSGKSSMMQPLLLLKQTLEAPYDAGALLLNGPNVKFTTAEQLLSRMGKRHSSDIFQVGMTLNTGDTFQTTFRKEHKTGFRIEQMDVGDWNFRPEMTQADIVKTGITRGLDFSELAAKGHGPGEWKILRDRCFIGPVWLAKGPDGTSFSHGGRPGARWEEIIPHVIYLPGVRANPERTCPVAAVGSIYPGPFDKYTASVVSEWQDMKGGDSLAQLNDGPQRTSGSTEGHLPPAGA